MDMQYSLDTERMRILLSVHDALMTWNTDKKVMLKEVCEKLLIARPYHLVWVALFDDDELQVIAAAGVGDTPILGTRLEYRNVLTKPSLNACISRLSPVMLTRGLRDMLWDQAVPLPQTIRALPAALYPLSTQERCIGLLGVIAERKHDAWAVDDILLLDKVSQHTSFALGMLQAFAAEKAAVDDLRLAAAVFDHALEGIFITGADGTIMVANAAVSRITGYSSDELVGSNPKILQSGKHDREFYAALWKSICETGQWTGEIWNRRKNGEIYPELLSISAIPNADGCSCNYLGIFMDISAQKEVEQRLDYLAHHDPLTHLPNRELFNDRLVVAVRQAKRHQESLALLFIDLDNFKYINDTFGHAEGDRLLQAMARRLSGCLREEDTLARMGGDEFTALIRDIHERKDAELVAQKIVSCLEEPFEVGTEKLAVTASIGISLYPDDGDTPAKLMMHSDTTMYRAKELGRNMVQFFRSTMDEYFIRRVNIENHLRNALVQNEFTLFYQPQFDIRLGRITGVEALIRWQRPSVGLIPPDEFIPLAETTGLIVPIDQWVLKTACAQCKTWHDAGYPHLSVAVNLSAHHFRRTNLIKVIAEVLHETGLDPNSLELELTESIAMHDTEATANTLAALKALGVRTALDDFGMGYSSLSYLRHFPIDTLKIDRSFVEGISEEPYDAAIVVAVIAMAHTLGLTVIAEGVETEEQLAFLKMHHCNLAQGFLLGRPVPAEEISATLRSVR
jgi:diguanylate cyclase (GGDEF)-like protein/PAS domain S-box-containing protein